MANRWSESWVVVAACLVAFLGAAAGCGPGASNAGTGGSGGGAAGAGVGGAGNGTPMPRGGASGAGGPSDAGTAGATGGSSVTGPGPADAAAAVTLVDPEGLALDRKGNLFVGSLVKFPFRNVLEITLASNVARVVASNPPAVLLTDTALLADVPSLVYDGAAGLFVPTGSLVLQVDPGTATATVFAGSPDQQTGHADGVGTAARFVNTYGAALDSHGNLYVTDQHDHTIRQIVLSTGDVSTFAGMSGQTGYVDDIGSAARFVDPIYLAYDANRDSLYVSDGNGTIRQILVATGAVTTLAGYGMTGIVSDGIGRDARFGYTYGLANDDNDGMFVADSGTIRHVSLSDGAVTTIAGHPRENPSIDGVGGGLRR